MVRVPVAVALGGLLSKQGSTCAKARNRKELGETGGMLGWGCAAFSPRPHLRAHLPGHCWGHFCSATGNVVPRAFGAVCWVSVQEWSCRDFFSFLFIFFGKDFIYLFLERGEEREKNINVWLLLSHPLLGTWPAPQAYALTGNRTGDPLVHRLALSPLSHNSQGRNRCFEKCVQVWKQRPGRRVMPGFNYDDNCASTSSSECSLPASVTHSVKWV